MLRDQLPRSEADFHHAYLITGRSEGLEEVLAEVLGISGPGHPDLARYGLELLTVDEVRRIREDQARKPLAANRLVLIIEAPRMTSEAQNALLKVLEEPAESAVFFIVVPRLDGLLPTLLSRVRVLSGQGGLEYSGVETAAFLAAEAPVRLQLLSPLISPPQAEPEAAQKKRRGAELFLDELEIRLAASGRRTDQALTTETAEALSELLTLKEHLREPGGSVKLILEYLALRLPRMV